MRPRAPEAGFTLIDTLVVITIIGIISAMSLPSIMNSVSAMRLGQSARVVEREVQTAKQRAVSKGRAIRVRFNCPVVGQYRIVELIGSPAAPAAADAPADRCSETAYPFPAADADPLTRPNLDGPIRRLDTEVSFTTFPTIEFWPDGTAHYNTGGGDPWPMIPTAGISVTLARSSKTSTITVNGLGKVLLTTQ